MGMTGNELAARFLEYAWPRTSADDPIEYVGWKEIAEVFFENADQPKREAEKGGRVWSEAAIAEVDGALEAMAAEGIPDFHLRLSHEGAEELWRRWEWTIIASMLEDRAGVPIRLPLPAEAPDDVKGAAVVLCMLAGPGRDYRRDLSGGRR